MKRRSVLAGLAIVVAIAVAVPALAGQSVGPIGPNTFASSAKKVSQEARKLAHKALKKSNKALRKIRRGQQGLSGPAGPTGPPGPAGASPAAPFFGQTAGPNSTTSVVSYVDLGGPSVTVTVPQAANGPAGTGFISVAAQSHIDDNAGAVALFEDGAPMPGQSDICDAITGTPSPPLFGSTDGLAGTWSTPASIIFTGNCGSTGPPAPVLFTTTPGSHTYELRYNFCGCQGADATFSDRKLWVTPLG